MPTETLLVQPAWLTPQQPRQGRYVLGPILGQGGMGEVREAWDVLLHRTVALKILKAMDPLSLIRFMREAQIHARVIHPNICRIYDVESAEGAPRIAMQLVRGEDLAEAAPHLSVSELIPIFAVAAEAMHAAHRQKLIHRDLKPSNILLERTADGNLVPYICDFGLAMILDEPGLTYSQGVKGTPAFMAPEQVRGERRLIGPATDVYALGGTLYFSLYGQVPLGATQDIETLLGRRSRPMILPRCPKPGLPKDLETILKKCLDPDPAQRFSSMGALAEELWRVHRQTPILTRPAGTLDPWLPFLRKHRRASTLATLAAAIVILGLGLGQRHLSLRDERRADWARFFVLDAADAENDLRVEEMLPIHDMRPAYARIHQHMDEIRARMENLGPDAQGLGLYALGHARFLLRDEAGARQDLEKAWAQGNRSPELASLLARTLVEAQYRSGNANQDPAAAQRVEALLGQSHGLSVNPEEFAQGLLAYSQRDFARAAAAAHATDLTHPWHGASARLETLSLCALARQQYEAGDLDGAQSHYQEALGAAHRFLSVRQSDVGIHHAYLLAGRGLVHLQWRRGTLALDFVTELQRHCQEALRLDESQMDLQDDWLVLTSLKAARMRDLGQDPAPELAKARNFLETRVKEPLSPELRADRLLLHWRLGEPASTPGPDPRPELVRVLEEACPVHRDLLGAALNVKAEAEAARGGDPRPILEAALACFHPLLQAVPSWPLGELACESWLIRATWEAARHLDATVSLRNTQALAERALQSHTASPSAYALEGLAWAQERKAVPERRRILTIMARERLQASLARGLAPRLQARLRQDLQD